MADQVRGLPVDAALNILTFSPKKGAVLLKKVLESAIANAEHNEGADIDTLKVTTVYVDKGPSLKRFTARAKGRQPHREANLPHHADRGQLRTRAWDRRLIRGFPPLRKQNWSSKWFANSQNFAGMLKEDIEVRDFLKKKLSHASVSRGD